MVRATVKRALRHQSILVIIVFLLGVFASLSITPFDSFADSAKKIVNLPSEEEQVAMNAAALMAIASLAVDSEIANRRVVTLNKEIGLLERRISSLEEKVSNIP
ncbi:hypothetical protein ACMAZH_04535 [Arenicellales bacterium nBUS_45]